MSNRAALLQIRLIAAVATGALGCSDAETPLAPCDSESDCPSQHRCLDSLCVFALAPPGSGSDAASPFVDGSALPPDAAIADGGAPPDAIVSPVPIGVARFYRPETGFNLGGVAPLGPDAVFFGINSDDSSPPIRRAELFSVGSDGNVRWAKRIGVRNEQLFSSVVVQGQAVLVGLTRTYGAGGDDILFVAPDTDGSLRIESWGSAGDELALAAATGPGADEFTIGGHSGSGAERNGVVGVFGADLRHRRSVVLDGDRPITIAAVATTEDHIAVAGRLGELTDTDQDAWIAVLDAAGRLLWSTVLSSGRIDNYVDVQPRDDGWIATGIADPETMITEFSAAGEVLQNRFATTGGGASLQVAVEGRAGPLRIGRLGGDALIGLDAPDGIGRFRRVDGIDLPACCGPPLIQLEPGSFQLAGRSDDLIAVVPFNDTLDVACPALESVALAGSVTPVTQSYPLDTSNRPLVGGPVSSPTVEDIVITPAGSTCGP